jgi:uncharacterized protein YdaU (DUF1376 family)
MHYYKFNIADYRKDTGHLSTLEHGIYRQLIDWYYLDEQPIPAETQVVARRLRLGSEMDMHSLKMVLSDFFVLGKNGYVHKRIDVEIKDYHENAEKNKNNGKLGGRPKKTQSVISGNPNDSQNNPNQEPLTNNQEPSKVAKATPDLGKPKSVPSAPIQEIVELYNRILPMLPSASVVNESRKRAIAARWREVVTTDKMDRQQGLEFFEWYFKMVKDSNFLTGKSKDWKADLDFLFNASKFPRIIEGTYHKDQK